MHIVKPKNDRTHLGIEFEHCVPGEMSSYGARAIHESLPAALRDVTDYYWETLGTMTKGYEAKLCVPQDEYRPYLTTLLTFLRGIGAIVRPPAGHPRFGMHVHVDLRFHDYAGVQAVTSALQGAADRLARHCDPVRVERKYYRRELKDCGYGTVEVRMMDSNFDLETRIIPYIDEIVRVADGARQAVVASRAIAA